MDDQRHAAVQSTALCMFACVERCGVVCMRRKTSVESGNGKEEVKILARGKCSKSARGLNVFVIVCDEEQSKERLRPGDAEEFYAHFRPTRAFMGSKTTIAISI